MCECADESIPEAGEQRKERCGGVYGSGVEGGECMIALRRGQSRRTANSCWEWAVFGVDRATADFCFVAGVA